MAQSTITLDILTPQGAKRSGLEVPGVEVPGIAGELGVLPDHVPFITPLIPGVIRFREKDTSQRLAIGAGFLEVTRDGRVSILTERALTVDEIELTKVHDRLKEVNAELGKDSGPIDAIEHRKLVNEQRWLEAQIRAAAS
ncbi:MAG: ATP synthase F1 subunit epsilon [Myxococcales bacterium]|nr:ATP synthase F1 subunit epsilon [Myxococcales bacterium]MCB9701455.1 ATP synthase F1 subunit epsilon [Myxococcales bacterium]